MYLNTENHRHIFETEIIFALKGRLRDLCGSILFFALFFALLASVRPLPIFVQWAAWFIAGCTAAIGCSARYASTSFVTTSVPYIIIACSGNVQTYS